jgi:hypothetical protein
MYDSVINVRLIGYGPLPVGHNLVVISKIFRRGLVLPGGVRGQRGMVYLTDQIFYVLILLL